MQKNKRHRRTMAQKGNMGKLTMPKVRRTIRSPIVGKEED